MDEKYLEQAQAQTERIIQEGIEQTLQNRLEPPLEVDGQRCCLGCWEPLSSARLKANPNAVRCVDCQNDRDRRGH